jgi:predicted oxidoreductase
MKTYTLPNTSLNITRIAYGCMLIGGNWSNAPMTSDERTKAARVVESALEHGINFFDHADIYCRGKSETIFAETIRELKIARDSIILQSKCGIRFADAPNPGDPHRYDFSYEHIIRSVEGSLRRLQTDYLDILLLHRPDALVEPAEVARAFDELQRAGKVKYFGVSNHNFAQIELLKQYVTQPLVVNQLELNLLHADVITDTLYLNRSPMPYTGITGTLDYCRANDILIQAWAPVANGRLFNPPEDASTHLKRAAGLIAHMAQMKNTTPEAVALAWLLRHPAPIQPILGTTNPNRVAACCLADDIELTREEWYALLSAARQEPLP